MGLLSFFRKIDRRRWFVCYTCMGASDHQELKSVFYSVAPKVLVVGREWQRCPRCGGTNTKSFAEIKSDGQDSAVWGLERIVKQHPRSVFEVTPSDAARTT